MIRRSLTSRSSSSGLGAGGVYSTRAVDDELEDEGGRGGFSVDTICKSPAATEVNLPPDIISVSKNPKLDIVLPISPLAQHSGKRKSKTKECVAGK